MDDDRVRAVILVPDGEPAQRNAWQRECLKHCATRGYEVAGYAHHWQGAAHMMISGRAHVIVAAEVGHFPPDRIPRIETAGQPPTTPGPPRQRRPRGIGHYS